MTRKFNQDRNKPFFLYEITVMTHSIPTDRSEQKYCLDPGQTVQSDQSLHFLPFCLHLLEHYSTAQILEQLELVFIKHYIPNSLPLTVNSHHVLFVKRLPFLCFIIFSPEIFQGP